MKKRFRGFTLIECIVAMAILGIASLIIAQMYAAVSTRNKMNHLVNSSLSHQMQYVEKYTDSETVSISYATSGGAVGTPATPKSAPSYSSYDNTVIQIENVATGSKYTYPVDVYVLKSRDRQGNQLTSDSGYTEENYNLRYKYVQGYTP